ncbi:MAG: hypothetical protein FK733_04380 [Asgard group archaeon]|nr:hypothetical protein [Asgard group archaeon]
MKSSSICPKCSSKRIVGPLIRSRNYDRIGFETDKPIIEETFSFIVYACADCGFYEYYFDDKGIEKLKEMVAK